MQHLTLKAATTTTTDQGVLVKALRAWVPTDRLIPLAWNHSGNPEDIIGHINPTSVKAVGNQVIVDGWVDQSTPRGGAAWRVIKSGVAGFSFGNLIINAVKRADGVREIRAPDVFAISATPTRSTPVRGWCLGSPPADTDRSGTSRRGGRSGARRRAATQSRRD